ncbi:MAG TPA: autotransporter-associated beta strand repeat-containing protein, partial [Bosea sp. (in: a-proteobacteria)]|uniref:autotransporter-associated beta strand repeat-containing protein n=1 Tax=Bosea sp. (in: a-proteobacteria) TaxID=1871050 RepID=UPI002E130660|nr:autotransporter-associated beta strand repeat-containing protein [Bosea sp. (in: a-proteobacteria)]
MLFWLNASAGNARLITNAGGETFFNGKSHDAVGSIAGAGNYVLSLWSLTTGGNGDTTEVSGVISGGGALIKAGAGTLTLSGANTYTGATTVNGGRLVVNGSLASAVTVNGGATLGGSGSVGGIAVASGGAVAPGNSIGALSVAGNVAFAAGSTYQVEINAAGQGDRIAATGMATLSGGTVQVLAEAGNYAAGTRYTILTANGGVTGQFAGVSSNLAFLTPTLVHGASDVTLTMTRNDTGFGPDGGGGSGGGSAGGGSGGGSGGEPPKPGGGGATGGGGSGSGPRPYIAATRNQGFIANAAERLGVGNPIYDTLVSATAAEARAGFDLLSGEA